MNKIRCTTLYNRNLPTPVRYARVGGFDYPSTTHRANQAIPIIVNQIHRYVILGVCVCILYLYARVGHHLKERK